MDAAQLAQYPGRKLKVSSSGLTKEENADFYKANTVAYYTFDNTDGREITDDSGNGNKGTFSGESWNDGTLNGATQTTGKYGNALSFDGNSNYLGMGHSSPDLSEISGDKLTVEAWIKPSILSNTKNIITKNGPFILRLEGDKLEGWVYAPWTSVTGNTPLSTNTWHHVAMVYDGSKISLYVDGKFDNSVSKTGALEGNGCVEIGRSNNGGCSGNPMFYFNGLIDEIRIYNKALSPQEIQEDMNSAYPVDRPVASWSFESVSANQVMDTHNVVKGRYGSALSFDGVDDYVEIPAADSLNFISASEITHVYWFKPLAAGDKRTLGHDLAFDGRWVNQKFGGGVYVDGAWRESDNPDTSPLNEWAHVATTYSETTRTVKVYVNGVEKVSQTLTGLTTYKITGANGVTAITGVWGDTYRPNGAIDEVRILNVARS